MVETFKAEHWRQHESELAGWPVRITSYKLKEEWRCQIDNVSPGATIARASGDSRDTAIDKASTKAAERLGRQRIFAH